MPHSSTTRSTANATTLTVGAVDRFSTGLRKDDWTAAWMTPAPPASPQAKERDKANATSHPTWWMRRTVAIDDVPERVALAIVCLGYYELYVNGKRVGNEPLAPSVTKLDKRVLCVTHEIGTLLRKGENCIAIWCASGWYLPHQFEVHEESTPLIRLQAYAQVGGKLRTLFGSDEEWRTHAANRQITGAWSWNNFGGEAVDGREESSEWKRLKCSSDGWHPVRVVSPPSITVSPRTCPPNRIGATYRARKVRELKAGLYEVDFGLCLAGQVRLRFPKAARDRRIEMRFFDLPADNDSEKDQSYGQLSSYIARGDGADCFEHKFNYAGFRYVTIEGLDGPPALSDMEAMLVETDLKPAGSFRCSNELFNRIHDLNVHTLRCLDVGGYSVDCPHRERLGYGADGQSALPAYLYTMDCGSFLHKWLVDWCDVYEPGTGRIQHTAPTKHYQDSPTWGGIVAPLAWKLWLYYRDREALEIAFPVIRGYLGYLQEAVRDGIVRRDARDWLFLGDWVAPGRGMDTFRNDWVNGNTTTEMRELVNTAYLIYLWQTYAAIAGVLSQDEAIREAEGHIGTLRKALHETYYVEEQGYYLLPEQTYQVMPLAVGAVPEPLRRQVHDRLIRMILDDNGGHIGTGITGTTFLIDYLIRTECHDVLATIYNQETYPGWGYMLASGATTIWEQWNGFWSQIHSCFAGPAEWFYAGLAGIRADPDAPGFKNVIIKPAIVGAPSSVGSSGAAGLTWVMAHHESSYGRIESHWKREGDAINVAVKIPPNSTATVFLPAKHAADVTVDGSSIQKAEYVTFREMKNDRVVVDLGSGSYEFLCK